MGTCLSYSVVVKWAWRFLPSRFLTSLETWQWRVHCRHGIRCSNVVVCLLEAPRFPLQSWSIKLSGWTYGDFVWRQLWSINFEHVIVVMWHTKRGWCDGANLVCYSVMCGKKHSSFTFVTHFPLPPAEQSLLILYFYILYSKCSLAWHMWYCTIHLNGNGSCSWFITDKSNK